VRSLMVVVRDVLPEDPLEMALALNEHPVEALGPRRPDKALRERVRPGRPDRVRTSIVCWTTSGTQ
jgi:hypothetical protein